jgi:hypothetical protein
MKPLLPQPGGFEGLLPIGECLHPRHQPVLDGDKPGPVHFYLCREVRGGDEGLDDRDDTWTPSPPDETLTSTLTDLALLTSVFRERREP